MLTGLFRGSISCKKFDTINSKKSLRKNRTLDKNTLERRRKLRSNNSGNAGHRKSADPIEPQSEAYTTITIKPIEINMDESDLMRKGNPIGDTRDESLDRKYDDANKEWAAIADIMASFGTNLEEVKDEAKLDAPPKEDEVKSVGEWLDKLGLSEYHELLANNGYDDIRFMVCCLQLECLLIESMDFNSEALFITIVGDTCWRMNHSAQVFEI